MLQSQYPGITAAGVRAEFQQKFEETETYYQDLSTLTRSNSESESYRWLGSTPTMREWIGGRQLKGLRSERYDLTNKLYEATMSVSIDDLRRDKVGGLRMRIAELADRAATHPDTVLEGLINNGGSAGFLAYDGQYFFDTDHASGDSGSQSNDITYDAVTPSAPTVAEFKSSLQAAISKLMSFVDDRGVSLRTTPTGLVCVVHPNLIFTAAEALSATIINSTSNVLQTNPLTGAIRVIALPGLSDATKWTLFKTNVPVRPFIFQEEQAATLDWVAEGSEYEFDNLQHKYGVSRIYALGYGMWQYAIRTTLV